MVERLSAVTPPDPDANLHIRHYYEATAPGFDFFVPEYLFEPSRERQTTWHSQAHKNDAVMQAGAELADIGEIQILSDEKAVGVLRCAPNSRVGLTR